MTRLGRRLRVLSGNAAHARFLAETEDGMLGTIPAEIRQPYSFSDTHQVLDWRGQPVIVVEVRHQRFEVFQVAGPVDPIEGGGQ